MPFIHQFCKFPTEVHFVEISRCLKNLCISTYAFQLIIIFLNNHLYTLKKYKYFISLKCIKRNVKFHSNLWPTWFNLLLLSNKFIQFYHGYVKDQSNMISIKTLNTCVECMCVCVYQFWNHVHEWIQGHSKMKLKVIRLNIDGTLKHIFMYLI